MFFAFRRLFAPGRFFDLPCHRLARGKTPRAVFLCGLLALLNLPCSTAAQEDTWAQRDQWQNVPVIFEAMGIASGSAVADVGARDGYLTVRLAEAVGSQGRVFAVDIDAEALARLRENLANLSPADTGRVTVTHSRPDDPMLPSDSLDAVVIVNAYHEMDDYASMLQHLRAALKPNGRLVLVEPIARARREASREAQAKAHEIGLRYAREDLRAAGFEIVEERDPFLPRKHRNDEMWLMVARPLPAP